MTSASPPADRGDFEIAVVCALSLEAECVYDVLDNIWEEKRFGKALGDDNPYTLGAIGEHNVVLVHLPGMGTIRAAYAIEDLKMSFPNIKFALVVGICGGMPFGPQNKEIILGDVVVSKALIQYDFGKNYPRGFQRKTDILDTLGPPSEKILALQAKLGMRQHIEAMQEQTAMFLQDIQEKSSKAKHPGVENDILYHSAYHHQHRLPAFCAQCEKGEEVCEAAIEMKCEELGCESVMHVTRKRLVDPATTQPAIHFGIMGSANTVMKSGYHRDVLARTEGIVAVEMEGAGVWRHGPSIVIKGVCDYGDSHKRKGWQQYAAATAAACLKAFLMQWIPEKRKSRSGRNFLDESPMLGSDSIFLQERLLVDPDIDSFLTEALSCSNRVRIVLHGLPGVGKSTVARSFAYNVQKNIAVLWIPGDSEIAIKQAFERYARQMGGKDQQCLECVSFVASQLSERFYNQWLVVYDGLDNTVINIQQYLFADLRESKILITTRNKDFSSYIEATHVRQMNHLNARIGQDLLNVYMDTDSGSLTVGQALREEQTPEETDARRRIVKELGGLPLAIAVVGTALRKEKGVPSINSQAYLTWADEVKDTLLEQDPVFSDYSSSVWKSFQLAFRGILQGAGISKYARSLAYFAASCENGSDLTEYIRLYRKFRTSNTTNTLSAPNLGRSVIDQLRFLEIGFFELAIKALAAVSMITVNWRNCGPDEVPYIEMHSLVRKWLNGIDRDKIFTYAGSKMWLLGFDMYSHLNGSGIGTWKFEPLLEAISQKLIDGPTMLDGSQVPAPETVFPLLLDAQIRLSKSTDFFPTGSTQRGRLRHFSKELEPEIRNSYHVNLRDVDWNSVFQNWARELGEGVEFAVTLDAAKDDYQLKDFFISTLDSSECIPIAFAYEAPYELHHVGQTDQIENIKTDITTRTISSLIEHLAPEAFGQLLAVAPHESSAVILTWSERWEKDVAEIIRNSLAEVFVELQSAADIQLHAPELPSPSSRAVAGMAQSFGDDLLRMNNSSNPRSAFFAVLRRTVQAATEQFLDFCPIIGILNEHKDTFRDICERAIRKGFGNRSADAFLSPPISSEVGTEAVFSMVWELAWHGRFLGDLHNLLAAVTFDAISDDLKNAAKQGSSSAFECYLNYDLLLLEELTCKVFENSSIHNTFLNWKMSGWIDPPNNDEDIDDKELTYPNLLYESKQQVLSAMKSIYEDNVNVVCKDRAVQVLNSILHCRRVIHDEVMDRLNQSGLTDRTGMGPFFALLHFKDCDKSLRLACSILQAGTSENFVTSLDHLIRAEKSWNLFKS